MDTINNKYVHWLDGYLNGLFLICGETINSCRAASALLARNRTESAEESLVKFYTSQGYVLEILSVDSLGKSLELEIYDNLLENILGDSRCQINSNALNDKKQYAAFKVMDIIDFVFSDYGIASVDIDKVTVKITAFIPDFNEVCLFFCIPFEENVLILSFSRQRS